MLELLIKSARQNVEEYLRYSVMTSTWELYLDSFPKTGDCVYIQKSPVSAITTFKYYNTSGVLTTLTENTDFVSDFVSKPCRLYEAYGKSWPTPRVIRNCVVIRFVAGYVTPAAAPEEIKQAILMMAASLYENPADEVTGTQVNAINKNSEWILRPLRAIRY
jgi:uncharacterized phiE125 gp8 family phage protein